MSSDTVIKVEGLSKIYKLYDSPVDRLKETFHPLKKSYHSDFYALADVSFSVNKGEVVGIVGKNGAGKSTLLQILTGVLTPTSGNVEVVGNVSALLELGGGFNPELTGLENVYFKSSLLGYSNDKIDEKLDEIIAFADIGQFINQPLKTYSSGMFVRLAFAVAINVDPDILIIDEALAVGDFRFKQKCLRKINQFREDNKTILFVSHDQGSVIEFCTRAIWLLDGKIYSSGEPKDVCKGYQAYMTYGGLPGEVQTGQSEQADATRNDENPYMDDVSACASFGDGGVIIVGVTLRYKKDLKRIVIFEGGERVVFSLRILANKRIVNPIIGFVVSDVKGVQLFGMNTVSLGINTGEFGAGEEKTIDFEFDFPYLKQGNYSFSPAIAEGTQLEHVQHQWVHDAYIVRVASVHPGASLGHYFVMKENIDIRVGSSNE